MDTSLMEYTAEDLVAHKLQRSGILIAKPRFDQEGADLLAFLQVKDGAKFCRIQCKGRSLFQSTTTHVEVPKKYVTGAFVLFLFIETGIKHKTLLYCFTAANIHDKWSSEEDQFSLSISETKLTSSLAEFEFNDDKIVRIRSIIEGSDTSEEFRQIIHGTLNVTLDPVTLKATGTVGNPPVES